MDQATQLRQRWLTEQQRLTMYRRQRAVVHCNAARPLEDIVAEAEDLDADIAMSRTLMDECLDEWLALPRQREA